MSKLVGQVRITGPQLARRIEKWQKRLTPLGIGHVRIEEVVQCDETPGGPGSVASVRLSHLYDKASFFFTFDFLEEATEQELDETIIHEWLHVAMRDFDNELDSVESWLPPASYTDWSAVVDRRREQLIDRVALTLYQLYVVRS